MTTQAHTGDVAIELASIDANAVKDEDIATPNSENRVWWVLRACGAGTWRHGNFGLWLWLPIYGLCVLFANIYFTVVYQLDPDSRNLS